MEVKQCPGDIVGMSHSVPLVPKVPNVAGTPHITRENTSAALAFCRAPDISHR